MVRSYLAGSFPPLIEEYQYLCLCASSKRGKFATKGVFVCAKSVGCVGANAIVGVYSYSHYIL